MSLTEIAQSMKARMPWEVGQKVLELHNAPRSMGWDRTLEKLSDDAGDLGEAEADLREALREHLLCGEKLCRFYELTVGRMEELRAALRQAPISDGPFADAYPLLLTEDQIIANHPSAPHLIALEERDDGIAAVFASTRAIELRETLSVDDLEPAAAEALAGYEEVVAIRHAKSQAVDVVWVPSTGTLIDVRIDFPKGMHQDAGDFAHERMRQIVQNLLGSDFLSTPANLFGLIERMYVEPTEGTVVELAFGTSTASLKHEKMRRRSLCLRSEAYHVGGKAALSVPIEPYKLSIQWDREHGDTRSRPEMSLNGTLRMAKSGNSELTEVAIRKCVALEDFAFIWSRIAHYLMSEADEATAEAA